MILPQRYPTMFNGIVSGDPAMRTGFSNLAVGKWIPEAYISLSRRAEVWRLMLPKRRADSGG
jgi:hypothetical protein